ANTTNKLLKDFESKMNQIRDEVLSNTRTSTKAVQRLDFIMTDFLKLSADMQLVCADLQPIVVSNQHYSYIPNFLPSVASDKLPSYLETLRSADEYTIERLEKLERIVREAILTSGNVLTATSNLKLQYFVFVLTIITIGLSVISNINDIRNFLWQFISMP
ncbi:MAG: hypothetical protein AAF126_16950, partial [Chloroflexota bacterium]